MARKYDLISELYNRTCKTVVSNPQNWQAFLASACRNYKLRYDEQLLVYAQRPDATAVLEIEQWNKIFGRWVNRGARGIAVFADENRSRQRLTHYFDISDTHESRYSRTVPIWDMRQEYEADVIETLESTFGEIENKSSLAEAIMGAARNAAEDNIPDYLQDLYYATEGSSFEEVEEDIVAFIYKNVVTNSVAYMMMSRLGVDTDGYFELDDFRDVTNFNTQETLNALGFATSDIAEMGLTEISKTITALNRQNRIIVGQDRNEYNKVENNDERSLDNERTDLHDGGRLQPSEPETSTAAGSDAGQVRSDEERVSEGTSQSPLLQSPDEGRTDTALGGSGTESQQDGGNNPEQDGTERGSDRTDESGGYDEMGSSDELSSQFGTGNRESGSDIRLEYYDRTHEDKSLPFFGRDEVINEILRTTPHLSASLEEIKDYYERNPDNKDRTEYIKSIFNNDYTELTLEDGRTVGYKTFENVLHLWEGKYDSRTAQSFYDWAVIARHFEAMRLLGELSDSIKPLPSMDGQRAILEQQLEEITGGIAELKRNRGENFSIKQLEKSKKSIKQKLDKLNDQTKKDDVVTFEELGVDRLFVDESHYYKNLYLYTKMRNVGGIAQTEAQKSSDLFMKCRYLDEITGGRGTIFATGTPISNSMVELYTIQRYLQYNTLVKNGLQHFDAWASTFGETITAVELTPEGTGYRAKTRFAKFYNLPELMAMFKEIADIKTADMLNLPVPEAKYHNIAVKPSEMQKEMVASLAERAEQVRGGGVDSSVDNMLKITNDGRKLALDQRMLNDTLPDFEGSKINACVDNIYRIWKENADKKSAQLVFCDLSTPKNDGTFSVYNDIRKKLIERGIPESEVKFIHEADTDMKKKELFQKTRKGEVRVLLGSTQKMGAGTNVQDKLIALHDVDCPWRPSDLEQRSGRIVRQGNENPQVDIYRYVTEQTFDAYLYQLVEGKQKFASQIMTSKSPVRSAEDIDETALSYAEIKMLATGNPYIKEKMDLDIQVQKLKMLKSNFLSEKYGLEDKVIKFYPQQIAYLKSRVEGLTKDVETAKLHPKPIDEQPLGMMVSGVSYSEKAEAGQAIINACKSMNSPNAIPLGEYRGFQMELYFDTVQRNYVVKLKGETSRDVPLGDDSHGNIVRIDNGIERFEEALADTKNSLENTEKQFETAKQEIEKPFAKEEELRAKTARLDELNILLNMDKKENEIVGGEPDEGEAVGDRKEKSYER